VKARPSRRGAFATSNGSGQLVRNLRRLGAPVSDAVVVADLAPFDSPSTLQEWSRRVAVRSADAASATLLKRAQSRAELIEPGCPDMYSEPFSDLDISLGGLPPDAQFIQLAMPLPAVCGLLYVDPDYEDDLVAVHPYEVSAGPIWWHLPKLRGLERLPRDLRADRRAVELARVSKKARRLFGDGGCVIEWAEGLDGTLFVVGFGLGIDRRWRIDTFTAANLLESFPAVPSVFMADMLRRASNDVWEWWRDFDPTLPLVDRPFFKLEEGRPYVNLSLIRDMLAHQGLSSDIGLASVGGDVGDALPWRPRRLVIHAGVWLRQLRAMWLAPRAARRVAQQLLDVTAVAPSCFGEAVELATLMTSRFITQAAQITLGTAVGSALLRRFGVLEEHSQRQRTAGTALIDNLRPLRELVARTPSIAAALREGEMPADPTFRELWAAWDERFGHRGLAETDLSQPRFREDFRPIFDVILSDRPEQSSRISRSVRGVLTSPIAWFTLRQIRARESFRDQVVRAWGELRTSILGLAEGAVASGRIPESEGVWMLTGAEMAALDGTFIDYSGLVADRERERAAWVAASMPQDSVGGSRGASTDLRLQAGDSLRGVGLTRGRATGRAWISRTPERLPPDSFDADGIILIAPVASPGWVPLYARVAGVIVEMGGDLSHGAIMLREMAVPTIANVPDAVSRIPSDALVEIDCAVGTVTVVSVGNP